MGTSQASPRFRTSAPAKGWAKERSLASAWTFSLVVALGAVLVVSCSKDGSESTAGKPSPPPTAGKATAPTSAAETATKVTPEPANKSESGIVWIKDDWSAAKAASKKANLPLVVDMWAPWCHTCISMKHTVLLDPGLSGHAKRFVWLALDTDKAVNAAALAKLPVSAWPTFYVLAPSAGRAPEVAAQFLGSASVKQFREFLNQGEAAARDGDDSIAVGSPADLLRTADRASTTRDYKLAAKNYRLALKAAPAEWPRRPDVLVSLASTLYKSGDKKACAKLGLSSLVETTSAKSASTADFSYYVNECANETLKGKELAGLRETSIAAIKAISSDPGASLAADDRSDGWRIIRELELARGNKVAAKEAAKTQQRILDEAAKSAANPFFAMAYNWPRAEVYVHLEEQEALVEPLKKSAAALPKEYDPPYRLAWVLFTLKRYDEAREAALAAATLVYGPRKARVLGLIAEIEKGAGNLGAAKAALGESVKHLESLPEGQKSEKAIERAKKTLAELK